MVSRTFFAAAFAVALSVLPAMAQTDLSKAPPPAPYAQVSTLVALPDFLPGLGTLYVDPKALPAGPFLGYDHDGKLAATIYMTPIEDLQNGTAYNDLPLADPNVTSVDIYYNAGHPGVEKPHVHIVLYHGTDAKDRLSK